MSDLSLSLATQSAETDAILASVLEEQAQKGPDLHQTHPKSHGLVWGEFIVEDNIPESWLVGVFAKKRSYPIWVRLSNASAPEKRGKFKSDLEPDIHGLAIKLLEVEGEKVLDDEKYTQDFIFLSHPVFITRTLQQFAFIKLATVKIPAQKFDFEERNRLNEGLSFSPWHTLPEHEPLGVINLARKKIYLEAVKFRHQYTEQRLREPQPNSQILDEPDTNS